MNKLIDLNVKGDKRGKLIAIEDFEIPFKIRRIFYIFDTANNVQRGVHSHIKTKQLLIAIHGSCKIVLDDGVKKETFILENNRNALFQNRMVWGDMSEFSADCVLLVLADSPYNKSDYILNYQDFLSELKINNS
jgi:dTDP-4-dehydrorhamnose 3,5-epimerase-like enzyme